MDDLDFYEVFCDVEGFKFFLLVDFDGVVIKIYGFWFSGMVLWYIYVIDFEGILWERFLGVRFVIYSEEVLVWLVEL